jgi:ABC-type sulfate/molybdate transport systems ATPase subunit
MIDPERLATEFAALGLSPLMARSQAALTTDERARLALAIGAATRHPLLLLDGTPDALSAAARPDVRACLERVAHQGGAVLLTGRDRAAVEALADRVMRLVDGRLSEVGTPDAPRMPARVAERGAAPSVR